MAALTWPAPVTRAVVYALGLAVAAPVAGPAQTVQGRLVGATEDAAVAGALVVLVDAAGRHVTRGASSTTGGFSLRAAGPGHYRIAVRQIGWRAWESSLFGLSDGQTLALTLRVDAQPYALPTITVEARRPRCGIRLGDDELVSRLLTVAETALALAQATADEGTLGFSSEWYVARYTPTRELMDSSSSSSGVGRLSSWPIQSAPPDTLEQWGFVRTDQPGQRWSDVGAARGPVYYGLDARTLFGDWFLSSHCFRLADARAAELRVAFAPEGGRSERVDVAGTLVLDRASLELRRIEFEYVGLPGWVPGQRAGGEVRLRRLRSGAWVPYAWRVLAPVPLWATGRIHPRLSAWIERGGWVRSVRDRSGKVDSALTREVVGAE